MLLQAQPMLLCTGTTDAASAITYAAGAGTTDAVTGTTEVAAGTTDADIDAATDAADTADAAGTTDAAGAGTINAAGVGTTDAAAGTTDAAGAGTINAAAATTGAAAAITDAAAATTNAAAGTTDADMDAGKTLVRTKTGRDELVIKPLGKSWGFRDGKLVEDTSKPLWVRQKGMKYLQYIRANEAEQLHGLQKGITGEQLKPSQRLKSIGNGWDIRAVKVLLKYWVPTKIMVKRTKSTRCHFSARRRACTIKTDRRKLHGKYLSRNKAYILRGISKKQESSYDFVHDALSHLSKSMLEKCCRYEVIKGLPKFDFDEIKDHNCFSCDKAQQRMPDSCKEMPEEFKAQFPMQHIYADIGTINAGDGCGGLVDIVCYRESPGKIRGYYPVETLADVPKMLNLFLKEHFHQVKDRRAMEKGLLIIKPDGDLGAFGKEFERVAQSFGYKVLFCACPFVAFLVRVPPSIRGWH